MPETIPDRELDFQPVEGLPPEPLCLVVEWRLVAALPGRGKRGSAGSVVAVLRLAAISQLRVACQCLAP